MWYGADPGGIGRFGVAKLAPDGTFQTWRCSSVDEALEHIDRPSGVGIDCPMWWSSGPTGGRQVDAKLRQKYTIGSGTIQAVNSLRGAAVVQGAVLASKLRQRFPSVMVTETHPKALMKACGLLSWRQISVRFGLVGDSSDSKYDHVDWQDERDALLGAVVVREAILKRWCVDLARIRPGSELEAGDSWFGDVNYWWYEAVD